MPENVLCIFFFSVLVFQFRTKRNAFGNFAHYKINIPKLGLRLGLVEKGERKRETLSIESLS